jgi:hypothetical protein
MSRHNITANNICNKEETDNSSVQVSSKITCAQGIKQVGSVWNIALIVDVNAVGSHVCQVLIFPRIYFKNILIVAFTDSIGAANPTGWSY